MGCRWKCSVSKKQVILHSFSMCKIWVRSFIKYLRLFSRIHWPATGTNLKSNPTPPIHTCTYTHTHTHAHTHSCTRRQRQSSQRSESAAKLVHNGYLSQYLHFPRRMKLPTAASAEPQMAFHLGKGRLTQEWGAGIHSTPATCPSGISRSYGVCPLLVTGLDNPASESKLMLNPFDSRGSTVD